MVNSGGSDVAVSTSGEESTLKVHQSAAAPLIRSHANVFVDATKHFFCAIDPDHWATYLDNNSLSAVCHSCTRICDIVDNNRYFVHDRWMFTSYLRTNQPSTKTVSTVVQRRQRWRRLVLAMVKNGFRNINELVDESNTWSRFEAETRWAEETFVHEPTLVIARASTTSAVGSVVQLDRTSQRIAFDVTRDFFCTIDSDH
jgi:hypothetical protein